MNLSYRHSNYFGILQQCRIYNNDPAFIIRASIGRGKIMKNYFLVIVWVMLAVVCLFGTPLSAAEKKLTIAMIQWRGETEACRGFKDGLKDLGYSVKYVIMNAGQNRKELGRLLRNELDPNINSFDYIYTFGTTVSKATKFIVKIGFHKYLLLLSPR
jgi:hypothetical protein